MAFAKVVNPVLASLQGLNISLHFGSFVSAVSIAILFSTLSLNKLSKLLSIHKLEDFFPVDKLLQLWKRYNLPSQIELLLDSRQCMYKIVAVIIFSGFLWGSASASPINPADYFTGGGKDSLKTATKTASPGVQVKKLDIPASIINPNVHKAAHWETVDLDMYHVDMTAFKDTLSYVLDDPIHGHIFHPPHEGRVTSGFGPRRLFGRKFHKGIDIDLETGDEVHAAISGKVRIARYSNGYGNFVIISHEGGLETLYGHMSELMVVEGQHIDAGTIIGLGGSTGQSTGSHLHFELRIFGEQVNPLLAIDPNTLMPREKEIKVHASWFDHLGSSVDSHNHNEEHFHEVVEGETLESISAMYEMEVSEILELNEYSDDKPIDLSPGTRLKVD